VGIECKYLYKKLNAKQGFIYDSPVEIYLSDYLARTWGRIVPSIYDNNGGGKALIFLPHFCYSGCV
jgi:hypothetical protein